MKNRVHYLDSLRILAICLVIMLHCINPYIINPGYYGSKSWIIFLILTEFVRAGVPIFLMVSGVLLLTNAKVDNLALFYNQRLKRVLIPLLSWNIIYFLWNVYFYQAEFKFSSFFHPLLAQGHSYHFWFVYTLIGIYLFTPFLRMIILQTTRKNLWILFVIITSTGTISTFINQVTPLYIFLFDPILENYLGYFLLGYLLGSGKMDKKLQYFLYFMGVLGVLIGVIGNYMASSPENINLIFNMGYSINHYMVATALFVFARCHFGDFKESKQKLITTLGNLTFGVFFVHVIIMNILEQFLPVQGSPIMMVLSTFVVTTISSFAISFLLSNVKLLRRYFL